VYGTVVSGDDRDVTVDRIWRGGDDARRAVMEVIPDDTMPSHEDIDPEEPGEPRPSTRPRRSPEAQDDTGPPDFAKNCNA
jgi:hypothetical protein